MAAQVGAQDVLDSLFSEDKELVGDDYDDKAENQHRQIRDNLRKCLGSFECGERFEKEMFVDLAEEKLLPLVKVCSKPLKLLEVLNVSSVNTALLLKNESKLWMQKIYRRLAGRNGFRHPFYTEFSRDIPVEIFKNLSRSIRKSSHIPEFKEPSCFTSSNAKAEIISFTQRFSVVWFLSLLSGNNPRNVNQCLERKLGATRKGHYRKVIVSETKDVALLYNFKKRQITISYTYVACNSLYLPKPT